MRVCVFSSPRLDRQRVCYDTVLYNIHLLLSFVCVFLLQLCTEHDNDELAFHGSFTDRQVARCANMREVNCAIGQITRL
jgi:hypothetical protein